MRTIAALITLIATLSGAQAQSEYFGGHVEASNQSMIADWIDFKCLKRDEKMNCHIIHSHIAYSLPASKRDAQISRLLKGDPVADFKKDPNSCRDMKRMADLLKDGKDVNGHPLDPNDLKEVKPMISAWATACQSPTIENIRRVTELLVDSEIRTCVISTDYQEKAFAPAGIPGSWSYQDGPLGDCGEVDISTIETDPKLPLIKTFTDRHVITTPENTDRITHQACKAEPESTVTYHNVYKSSPITCTSLKYGFPSSAQ